MATLETQYNRFLKSNPDSKFSFNEWMTWHRHQMEQAIIQMMQDDEELGLYDEPKQEDEFCYYSGLPSPAAYSKEEIKLEEVFNDEKKENIKKFIDEINNPSQPNDKLKQAFEKYSEYLEDYENKNTYEHGFKDGAKWQQQNSYSEEEVLKLVDNLFHKYSSDFRVSAKIDAKEWFEQFKNK